VVGFAAETENLLENASTKRKRKGCDWIVANDVSGGKIFDSDANEVVIITEEKPEYLPSMSKQSVAQKLVEKIIYNILSPNESGTIRKKKI
jgi:phosphopantothenoylcysteine synthetase/decarboxylase